MIELNGFLDLCKERTNTVSDSNLARKVDITRAALSAYRKGASFPSDANMVKLAKRAKLNVGECLLLLNVWRTEGAARKAYSGLFVSIYPNSGFL